jgi:hypothetical protein
MQNFMMKTLIHLQFECSLKILWIENVGINLPYQLRASYQHNLLLISITFFRVYLNVPQSPLWYSSGRWWSWRRRGALRTAGGCSSRRSTPQTGCRRVPPRPPSGCAAVATRACASGAPRAAARATARCCPAGRASKNFCKEPLVRNSTLTYLLIKLVCTSQQRSWPNTK